MSHSRKCRIMALIYNHSVITGHPFYAICPSTLKDVSNDDYPGESFFKKDIICIALDKYETMLSGENDCTMDAVVGVAEYSNNRIGRSSLALVELRLGYKSVSNLDFTKISRKLQHSRELLTGSLFHNRDYFVFTDRVAAIAENAFKRYMQTHPILKNSVPISVIGYENEIKDISDYPYEPINLKEDILSSLYIDNPERLMYQLDFWIKKTQEFRVKYEFSEARHILKILRDYLNSLHPFGEFTSELIDIYKEDVFNALGSIGE